MHSFNGKKRVAGSAFVVNCRTDRQFLHHNKLHGNANDECFDVKVGEVVMTSGKPNVYKTNNAYGFTGMNGANEAEMTRSKPRFLGVAETPSKFGDKSHDRGFVARVGGIITVYNGGIEQIHIGDPIKVALTKNYKEGEIYLQYNSDSNNNSEKGIHPQKIRYVFQKQINMEQFVVQKMAEIVDNNDNPATATELYKKVGSIWDDWRTTVVGTAKSACNPGQRFELLLHRRHY